MSTVDTTTRRTIRSRELAALAGARQALGAQTTAHAVALAYEAGLLPLRGVPR